MSMSSKADSVLVRYQGWAARRSSTSAGAVTVPCVPDDDQGVHEQGERDGALDGAPDAAAGLAGARTLRASANACSMPHGAAYRATRATGLAARSVVIRARS